MLFSFTATCKANEIEPWAYLRDVIQQLAAATPSTAEALDRLLPDAWLTAHPEARRQWSR